jgi:signal transduction histidine kinase
MPEKKLQRILYVEDDEGLARLLQKRMQRNNLAVDVSLSAEDALKRLEKETYDLLLVDYHLPGMNGIELLEALNATQKPPPVIILTASGDERVAVAALEKGAADYAVKDSGQTYMDLLPAVMQATYTKERLLRVNKQQTQELKIAKDKAEAANQAKSNFLATMSHEMRTPLNVIIGLARLLSEAELGAKERNMLNTILSSADLLMNLISDLLNLTRIESGQIQLEMQNFELSGLLEETRVMFAAQALEKKLDFKLVDETGGHAVAADRTRIQQILVNLVGNAIKFTAEGGVTLTAQAEKQGDKILVTLAVKDTGIGIPPEKVKAIFEKFTQADETITRRFGGTGLGLPIARSLAHLMNGEVAVESAPGQGSTFLLTLPLKAAGLPAQKTKAKKAQDQVSLSEAKGTVLVVEDYPPNVMVASMMLENLGFDVLTAEDGRQAIERVTAASSPFKAILMDVQMHDMDGLETTRQIRDSQRQVERSATLVNAF